MVDESSVKDTCTTTPGTFQLELRMTTVDDVSDDVTADSSTIDAASEANNTPFDITRTDVANTTAYDEQPLGEGPMSQSEVEDPEVPVFHVIENGTVRGKPKLVPSDVYSYIVKKKTARSVQHLALQCAKQVCTVLCQRASAG